MDYRERTAPKIGLTPNFLCFLGTPPHAKFKSNQYLISCGQGKPVSTGYSNTPTRNNNVIIDITELFSLAIWQLRMVWIYDRCVRPIVQRKGLSVNVKILFHIIWSYFVNVIQGVHKSGSRDSNSSITRIRIQGVLKLRSTNLDPGSHKVQFHGSGFRESQCLDPRIRNHGPKCSGSWIRILGFPDVQIYGSGF